jgi:hypothetical protein
MCHLLAKAKGGRVFPARLRKLEPIPKVSLCKIALYCQFIPDMSAMTERLNLRQGSATIADSHGATVGRGCSRKKRSISLAASGPRGSV